MHQDKDGQGKKHKIEDQDIIINNTENSLDNNPIILQILHLSDIMFVDIEIPLAPIAGSVWEISSLKAGEKNSWDAMGV